MDFARIIFRDLGRNSRPTIMTIASSEDSLFVFCALLSFAKLPDQMRAHVNSSVRLVCRNRKERPRRRANFQVSKCPEVTSVSLNSWLTHNRSKGDTR